MAINIREVENIRLSNVFSFVKNNPNEFYKHYPKNSFRFLGSGKAAIASVLSYLRKIKTIPDKTFEVMVPKWMGTWVYSQINHYALTSPVLTGKTKVLFVYHQYGYPQQMDQIMDFAHKHKLVIIEDCAHSLVSKTDSNKLGFHGDYTIHSFSKFFFCYSLGGVISKNMNYLEYLDSQIQNTPRWITLFNDTAKYISEISLSKNNNYDQFNSHLMALSYSLYNFGMGSSKRAKNLALSKMSKEIEIRKMYYKYFLDETNKYGICDHLIQEILVPYIIPIILKDKDVLKLVNTFRKNGFNTGIYHFDVNRCMLDPKFKNCIWVFCHSGLTKDEFEKQIYLIKKVIST